MTNAAVDVALRMRFEDGATPALNRAAQRAEQAQRRVAGATDEASAQQRRSYEKTSRAREDLAGQSEQRIRRELEQSEAAYNKAAAAARTGAGVQAGALDAARNKVQVLRTELERLQGVQARPVPAVKPLRAERNVPPTTPPAPPMPAPPANRQRNTPERYAPPTMTPTPTPTPTPTAPAPAPAQPPSRQRGTYERDSQARELLGVRSEKRIQEEIKATQRAYAAQAAAGFTSAQEQARYLDATRSKVQKLTNEMGRLTSEQIKQGKLAKELDTANARGAKAMQYGGMAVAGAVGAHAALSGRIVTADNFEATLADMANTAFNDRTQGGRIAGMKDLEVLVNRARLYGGGTREGSAQALNTLLAQDVKLKDAEVILPELVKGAKAFSASPDEMAKVLIAGTQNFKLDPSRAMALISAAGRAGQSGGFELKDMSKWLARQMPKGGNIGMSGEADFVRLLAWNQASRRTAGTEDEAGNNLADLLNELNTPHFKKFMAEQYLAGGHHMKRGQKFAAAKTMDDLFLAYQEKGVNKVDATADMLDKLIGKDKNYRGLQKKLQALDPQDKDGRKEIFNSMVQQVQGNNIGKIFHNQQSLQALMGILNNREFVAEVMRNSGAELKKRDGLEVNAAHGVVGSTAAYAKERASEDVKAAEKVVLDQTGTGKGLAGVISTIAQNFPVLAGSTTLAATGVTAMAGAAGLASIALARLSGGGALGNISGTAGVAGGAAAGGAITRAAGLAAPYLMQGGKLLLKGGAAAAAAGVGGMAVDAVTDKGSAANRYGNAALTGASVGAAVGSFVPVVGTMVGAGVGAIGGALVEWLNSYENPAMQKEPPRMQGEIKVSVSDDRVRVAQNMSATGMDATLSSGTGSVWTGAPL